MPGSLLPLCLWGARAKPVAVCLCACFAPRARDTHSLPALVRKSAHARRGLRQYAGNYKYNSLAGVEDEKQTGAIYGTGEKANVCLFPRGSVNPWNVRARRAELPQGCLALELAGTHAVSSRTCLTCCKISRKEQRSTGAAAAGAASHRERRARSCTRCRT